MTVRIYQTREDSSPAEPHHLGAGGGRADSLGLPNGSDPTVPDQHAADRPGLRCHRDEDGVLNDQLHHPASSLRVHPISSLTKGHGSWAASHHTGGPRQYPSTLMCRDQTIHTLRTLPYQLPSRPTHRSTD